MGNTSDSSSTTRVGADLTFSEGHSRDHVARDRGGDELDQDDERKQAGAARVLESKAETLEHLRGAWTSPRACPVFEDG